LYTYRKRTAPPPDLLALDATSREVCTARRATTDTPLQALVFLDDPVFVECAQALAARVQRELAGRDDDDRIAAARAAPTARARPPRRPAEAGPLRALFGRPRAALADAAACRAAAGGSSEPDVAALTLVCSTLLASDEVTVLR